MTKRRRPTRSPGPPTVARRRTGRGAKRAPTTLSREAIIKAALHEIDDTGLDAFSLRNLAQRLGVYPTAIQWHVESRSQLLAEVAALALADILPPGFPDSWQGYLRQLFQRFRAAMQRHPHIAPLIGTQLVANRGVDLDFVERLLAALAHAGFAGARLVGAYNAVIAALVGFTTQEFAPIPTDETKAWQGEIRHRLAHVESFTHPILAKNMKLLANHAFILRWQNGTDNPLTRSFDMFVEIVIAGLEQTAGRR
jgi:TetR/AcrR family transcriptional regulator, tetracycline repressor protein